jgi:hypothetical protein
MMRSATPVIKSGIMGISLIFVENTQVTDEYVVPPEVEVIQPQPVVSPPTYLSALSASQSSTQVDGSSTVSKASVRSWSQMVKGNCAIVPAVSPSAPATAPAALAPVPLPPLVKHLACARMEASALEEQFSRACSCIWMELFDSGLREVAFLLFFEGQIMLHINTKFRAEFERELLSRRQDAEADATTEYCGERDSGTLRYPVREVKTFDAKVVKCAAPTNLLPVRTSTPSPARGWFDSLRQSVVELLPPILRGTPSSSRCPTEVLNRDLQVDDGVFSFSLISSRREKIRVN